ncbi:MAG TPA: NUDIX hydrolase [Acidimicrobiales bacterium]|nr:NUDIX hydrolase [Acidimicrobiales bacterium]
MRDWRVASAVIEHDGQILLVENRRADGRVDWSMPGGVVEDGEDPILGLHREVVEETGLVVSEWGPLLWRTTARSTSMGFSLLAETFIAHAHGGDINISDPDGIVTDARWFALDDAIVALESTWVPTRQPFVGWLQERWSAPRTFDYSVEGDRANGLIVELLSSTT